VRILTWNLMHGRAVPPAGRELFEEFAEALAGWPWEAALLQEVPPWWPDRLAARLNAEQRFVLTSRNSLLAVRRAVAIRRPDLIKSNGGGANAILVRDGEILEHRVGRLSLLPERRWVHGVRLGCGLWVANLHLQGTLDQAREAAAFALAWAGPEPLVLGGDFNLRSVELEGFAPAGKNDVDHVLVRGMEVAEPARVLVRGQLSDHAPVSVVVENQETT
jgi:endonuclease/exonuclease/phosphatase family metal-dependent hydrolase